jgi:hypothetical protein
MVGHALRGTWGGRSATIWIIPDLIMKNGRGGQVQRFICGDQGCEVVTFAEQVPGLTSRYQRRTPGLRVVLERLALALAGRAGSRLAGVLGTGVSRSTLGAARMR